MRIKWLQCSTIREPERAVAAEEDERKSVSEEEFEDTAGDHEEAAHEEIYSSVN